MIKCNICPAAYAAGEGCRLNVPERYPDSLTARGCSMGKREIEKMLRAEQIKKEMQHCGPLHDVCAAGRAGGEINEY